jgi:hypothetical protein
MSQPLPPNPEPAQQPAALAEKPRGKPGLMIILAACIIVAVGVWLLVVFSQPKIKTSAGNFVITKARMWTESCLDVLPPAPPVQWQTRAISFSFFG